MTLLKNIQNIQRKLPDGVILVAVSKTKPAAMVKELYQSGHLDFGENKVQDLVAKQAELPPDIRWHMIGHLQSNKVKYIAPFVHLVHGVDSLKLLRVIDKEGAKNERVIDCLLQVHIAEESTKFGLAASELHQILEGDTFRELKNIRVRGLMGMATFTDDSDQVRREFRNLKRIFDGIKSSHFQAEESFDILSMGMSGDYEIAIEEGSNMVRIGSLIFGPRIYS